VSFGGLFSRQRKSRYSQLAHAVPGWNATTELVQPKIKLEKVENLQRSNKRHLHTTIHHTITTNPPANYHPKTHEFPEPPSKTPAKQPKSRLSPPQKMGQIRTHHLPTRSFFLAV
jgi:hypothetical protein